MTYSQKLRDPKWQKKRLLILERDGWKCQCCGASDKNLQVHHVYYAKRDPWDYPDESYQTLCDDCHEKRQDISDRASRGLLMYLKNLSTDKMDAAAKRMLGECLDSDQFRDHFINTALEALDCKSGMFPPELFQDAVMDICTGQIINESDFRVRMAIGMMLNHLNQKAKS